MTQVRVGALLVTHNSGSHIDQTLASIQEQTLQPDVVLVVDDNSHDDTVARIEQWARSFEQSGGQFLFQRSTATSTRGLSRIAANFSQGVRALGSVDLVALADHDDLWLDDRLQRQVALMTQMPHCSMLASNSWIDDTADTLFDVFDIPEDLGAASAADVLRFAIRRSVATGGASMIRPHRLIDSDALVPPAGWLHDRWWSLVAAAQGSLCVSGKPVIRYRLSQAQAVGLDRGRQASGGLRRLSRASWGDLQRLKSLHGLRKSAAPDLQGELQWGRLLRNVV